MSINTCDKCKKQFCNKYSLLSHQNRMYPCDRVIQCQRCNKMFKRTGHLNDHMKRKTPCTPKIREVAIIEAQLDADLERINAKKQADAELVGIKKDAGLEIEQARTHRKALIPSLPIADDPFYRFNYAPNVTYVDFNEKNMKRHINKNILRISIDDFGNMIGDDMKTKSVLVKLLELLYNNVDYPEYRNLIYSHTCDKFFAIRKNEFREVSYEDIKPIVMSNLLQIITNFREKYNSEASFEEQYTAHHNSVLEGFSNGKYRQFNIILTDCNQIVSITSSDTTSRPGVAVDDKFKNVVAVAVNEKNQIIRVIEWE